MNVFFFGNDGGDILGSIKCITEFGSVSAFFSLSCFCFLWFNFSFVHSKALGSCMDITPNAVDRMLRSCLCPF